MSKLYLIAFLLIVISCKKEKVRTGSVSSDSEIEQPEKSDTEYCKIKHINGFNLMVTYLPNLKQEKAGESVHFVFEIGTDGEQNKGNFLYKDASNQAEFAQNANYFNFQIIDDVKVTVNGEPYKVVLSNMENTYTLNDIRKIHFVAVPVSNDIKYSEITINELTFAYDDSTLGIGYTKFTFDAKN